MTALERFTRMTVPDPSTGCIIWTGAINKRGHGVFRISKTPDLVVYAHRYAYTEFIGSIPENADVHHVCHTRECVNPSHLESVCHIVHAAISNETRWGYSDEEPVY